ncbi:MAG: hypothetical protein U0235_18070 [Polyangiaceae bacterium]
MAALTHGVALSFACLLGACERPPPQREPASPIGTGSAPAAALSPASSLATASSASPGAPAEWAACASDAECTYVSLGCCDTTPVNRRFAAQAQARLDASGRPHCAVKQACGPGPAATWAGAAGKCRAGTCAPPPE